MEELEVIKYIDLGISVLTKIKSFSFGGMGISLVLIVLVKAFEFLKIFPDWKGKTLDNELKELEIKERKRKFENND